MSKLTDKEKAYLAELRSMAREKRHFTHRAMCEKFGWKSVASSWQYARALESKGYSIREVRIPIVTRAKAA